MDDADTNASGQDNAGQIQPDAAAQAAAAAAAAPSAKKGLAAEAQAELHVMVTAIKGVAHQVGTVVKLAWLEALDLIEGGKARPASQAEIDLANGVPSKAAPETAKGE